MQYPSSVDLCDSMVNVLATMQSRMCDSLSDQLHPRTVGLREMIRRTSNSSRLILAAGNFESSDAVPVPTQTWPPDPLDCSNISGMLLVWDDISS